MPDVQNNREGPQVREPSKHLNSRAMEKDWPKRPVIASYKRLRKDPGRAITPATEAVCVPEHLAPPGSPKAKQLHHLHNQLSLGQSCPSGEKKSCVYELRIASVLSDSL